MVVVDRFRITDTLVELWRPLVASFLLDALVRIAYVGLGWTRIVPAGLPLPLLGTGLAVFLGVRNNTAYARQALCTKVGNHSLMAASVMKPRKDDRVLS